MKNYFGVMIDMSRNGVMKMDTLKRFIDYLSKFGYNMIQLYTEDTFEVENEPYFGYLRGGYSIKDIQEIDRYCLSKGIELIPCVQTLAHLSTIFKWNEYSSINDVNDILLIDEPRTYQLIENIFKTLSKAFSSKKAHIGMDEAHMVGLGKYLDKHGYCNRFELLNKHLKKVVEIAQKYGFEPMMWSDMFFRISNDGEYYVKDAKLPKEVIENVPDVCLVYWDYYHKKKNDYRSMIKAHKSFNKDIWFAGGAWSWVGFTPANRYTMQTMKPALDVCKEEGIKNIFFTLWGDNGKECSYFSLLPSLYFLKRYYDGEKDVSTIKREFFDLVGESFDRMISVDLPNLVGGNKEGFRNPSKYMLYNDLTFGWLDTQVREGAEKEYESLARKFSIYAKQSENFAYLYEVYAKLCRVLSLKYNLGAKIRTAYKEKNVDELRLLTTIIKKTEKRVEEFYEAFRKLWHYENKPNGFEIHDMRLGGLIMRLKSCRRRIEDYLSKKEESLPELENVLLKILGNGLDCENQTPCYNIWGGMITVNQLN